MAENLELVCLADPLHFSHPSRWTPGWSRDLSVPSLLDHPGWVSRAFDVWRGYGPVGEPLPPEGWKLHVSTTVEDASRAVQIVGGYCARNGVAFKHLRSLALVAAADGRSAVRSSAGKAVVVYPRGDAQFLRVADDLALLLDGMSGPYVLSDRRWSDCAPVYFRYGAFVPLQTWTEDGRRVAARHDRSGGLVEDDRRVPFRLPDDVVVPDGVRERVGAFATPPAMPVRIASAVQHSGCGGVYRGVLVADGSPVVVKEARPHTGGSPDLETSVRRLHHEARVLEDLDGRSCPRPRAEFVVDGHHFMAADEVPGDSLRHWVAAHHPMLHPGSTHAQRGDYARRAHQVVDAVADAVAALHDAGWAHGDLHPGNVIVGEDLSVVLTDLEFADRPDSARVPGMVCSGFARAAGTLADRDRFAVAMTRAFVLHPVAVGGLLELDPTSLVTAADDAAAWFGYGPTGPVRVAADAYAAYGRVASRVAERSGHTIAPPPGSVTETHLLGYLHAVATPEQEQLVPADPAAMTGRVAALSVAHGAAGVVLALLDAGAEVPPSWSAHLARGVDAPPPPVASPGLWDGWAGLALACHALGDHDRARRALVAADALLPGCTDPTLGSGAAGWALVRLTLAQDLDDEEGADAARRFLDDLVSHPDRWAARCRTPGLLGGAAGVAAVLACVSGGEPDGGERWMAAARDYLEHDLSACRPAPGGALDLVGHDVGLPYLGAGSAGLALAVASVGAATGEPADKTVTALARSAHIPLMVEAGLHRGRIGLAFALDRLTATGQTEDPFETVLWRDHHLAHLSRHAVAVDGGVGVSGTGGCRLSADLATGAAGALAVLAAVRSPHPTRLDLLLATPSAAGPDRRPARRGPDGVSTVPSITGRR